MTVIEGSVAELEGELARRRENRTLDEEAEALAADLRSFVRACWPALEPETPFVPGWHIDAISDHLAAVSRGEIDRLIVTVPPGTMKSRLCSVIWPAWEWTWRPARRFLSASYAKELATDLAVLSRDLIRHPWYQARWGDVFRLKSDANLKTSYSNDRGGRRLATSVGGTGTGQHADVLLVDDPLNAKQAVSDARLQDCIGWHDGTLSTRFADPRKGAEVMIMQRLHERDLVGHVLDRDGPDRWTVLCLPEEYDPKHPFVWPGDPRTTEGELLWPPRIGEAEHAERKRALGSFRAAGQLQQRPAPPGGAILLRHLWRYYDPALLDNGAEALPRFTRIVHSWDTSFKDKTTSDYVVGTTWGVLGADRYLLRITRGQMGLTACCTALKEHYLWGVERWKRAAHTTLVENSANGPDVIATMKRAITGVQPVKVSVDKTQRAIAASPELEAGNIFLPGALDAELGGPDVGRTPAQVQEFVDECAAFPHGTHDDQVDSYSQAINWIRDHGASVLRISVASGPLVVGQ